MRKMLCFRLITASALLFLSQGYGQIQAIGGNGGTGVKYGGAGSGGRIVVYLAANKTFAGSLDTHGGVGAQLVASGSSGTVYIYHTGEYKNTAGRTSMQAPGLVGRGEQPFCESSKLLVKI